MGWDYVDRGYMDWGYVGWGYVGWGCRALMLGWAGGGHLDCRFLYRDVFLP